MRVPSVPGKARVLLPANASREEWLAKRGIGIGGSDIAALLGVSKYATAFDVFRSKHTDWSEPKFEGNVFTEWGQRLEDAVARKAADELGLIARTGGGLWQSVDHPLAIVTPDRILTRPRSWKGVGVVECKTAGDSEGWEDGGAPLHYQAQTQWQLGILGLDRGWLACLELGAARNFYLVELEFDAEWFAEMVNVAETFWSKHVLGDEPPMLDMAHPHTSELLGELHPKAVVPSIELPQEAAEWVVDYHAAKAAVDDATADLEELKNWLRFALGDAAAGYVGDRKVVSFPEVTTTRIDTKLLRELYPDVAREVEVTTTHRRLNVAKFPAK